MEWNKQNKPKKKYQARIDRDAGSHERVEKWLR
jgi:hypothetical protein